MTIVLVHGFWGSAFQWKGVVDELHAKGQDSIKIVELSLQNLATDARILQDCLNRIDDDVTLVGHSYGGVVITEAGVDEKVKKLVYLAAVAPDAGESIASIGKQYPMDTGLGNVLFQDADGNIWIKEEAYKPFLCGDVEDDTARFMAMALKSTKATLFGETVNHVAWKTKRSIYQVSTKDEMIHVDMQRYMAKRMGATVYELETSHMSMIAAPKQIGELILG